MDVDLIVSVIELTCLLGLQNTNRKSAQGIKLSDISSPHKLLQFEV